MPNKHAATKDLRKNKKRAAHNDRVKLNVRHLLKKSQELLKAGNAKESQAMVFAFQKAVDKATKVGVMSKSKASRKKSALMRSLNKK